MNKKKIIVILCLLGFLILMPEQALAVEPSMADYTSYPIFQLSTVAPNILIILDNSSSMNDQAYHGDYNHNTKYYGYFEPYEKYSYASNLFVRDPGSGQWDGNFLNWLTMRRVDVARKVLMGGLATARTGTGNQTNIGEAPSEAGHDFIKTFTDTLGVTPFPGSSGGKTYLVDAGYFYVDGVAHTIRVDKNMITYPDEAPGFVDGNIAGVLQKIGDKARWGNEFFNYGTGNGESGGYIASTIGTNITSLITDLQNTACNTYTPLAEAYYVAMQYFKQEDVQAGLEYPNNVIPNDNVGDDPFWNGTEYVYCAKSFVILLTDGASTMDMMIPGFIGTDNLKDYDQDSADPGTYPEFGSDYLDDIALYARTKDLRPDLAGDQNLILYTIYAFGNDSQAEALLKDAAKNGGYVEKNGTIGPDLVEEWDSNGDSVPDTYYQASNGYQLEAKILAAVNDILRRAASGSAVSVLATNGEGEANMVQAFYRPAVLQGLTDVRWIGYLQSLWVDPYGNLREDTINDLVLDVEEDKVITYFVDSGSGDTMVKRFSVSGTTPYPDTATATYEILSLKDVSPLWEAGTRLAQRTYGRTIFTYLDKDEDGIVDESIDDPFDDSGELVTFHTSSAPSIKPYLGVKDDTTWSYLGATHDERVSNTINYVRGVEVSGLRTRTIGGYVWKLGDIVQSTPVSVAKPPDNFHIVYSDESYQHYFDAFKDRETVVYVGANDGMLHAFTSWQYDATARQYVKPSTAPTDEQVGDELWAYIPQSLLPHLKWLPSPNYTHVYYVDLKPKIFDAKIFPDDTHYTDSDTEDNWGTLLLCGLNMGGKHIQAQGDFNNDSIDTEIRNFYPSYLCMDVTDPRNPRLLWERTYADLEMTTSIPAVVRVGDKWFAVFGSGPGDYDGTSTKKGHVFVVDLKTGEPYRSGTNDWLFETGESYAFMNSPVSIDKDLNFNVDALYFGETYLLGGTWKGKLYKVTVPCADASGNYDGSNLSNYSDNPLDTTNPWLFSSLFDAARPITSSVTLSKDAFGNLWVYGGTGRYLSNEDKTNADTQYIFGLKDPFYNKLHTPGGYYADDYYYNYSSSLELDMTDLLNSNDYLITLSGDVFESGISFGTWNDLIALAWTKDGWIKSLTITKERVLNKPAILGGIVFTPSFVPNDDICSCGGDSYLYGVYYETGTAYHDMVFAQGTTTVTLSGNTETVVLDKISLGSGKASSLGIHVGLGEEATGFVQQSTGNVLTEALNPALTVKSGLRSWQEK